MDDSKHRSKRDTLIAWKAEAEAQLTRVRKRLEPLEARRSELETKIEAIRTLIELERSDGSEVRATRSDSLPDAVFSVLQGAGDPLHYKAILERLNEQDYRMNAKDPEKTLRTYLSRDERFVNVGRGMWTIGDAFTVQQRSEGIAVASNSEDEDYDPFAEPATIGGDAISVDADLDYDPFAEE